jgi:nucleoside-diphosphate-sugar epimerase
MNSDVKFITDETRLRPEKSEVNRLWCDNSLISKLTGFSPQVNLSEGLKNTIDWFTEDKNLSKYKTSIYNQ